MLLPARGRAVEYPRVPDTGVDTSFTLYHQLIVSYLSFQPLRLSHKLNCNPAKSYKSFGPRLIMSLVLEFFGCTSRLESLPETL